jgi:hypothetical protein
MLHLSLISHLLQSECIAKLTFDRNKNTEVYFERKQGTYVNLPGSQWGRASLGLPGPPLPPTMLR